MDNSGVQSEGGYSDWEAEIGLRRSTSVESGDSLQRELASLEWQKSQLLDGGTERYAPSDFDDRLEQIESGIAYLRSKIAARANAAGEDERG